MTKVAGRAASYAPSLGIALSHLRSSASAIALGAAAITSSSSTSALAGSCTVSGPDEYICSGPAAGTDATVYIVNGTASITTTPGFELTPVTGGGLVITTTDGLLLTDENASTILSADPGISANNNGTGDLTVTTNGSVTSADDDGLWISNFGADTSVTVHDVTAGSDYSGINAYHRGSGSLNVASTGTIGGGYGGMYIRSGGTDTTINVVDINASNYGISSYHVGTGDLTITSTGTVTTDPEPAGGPSVGVRALTSGTGLTISVNDIVAGENGILAYNTGSGALTVTSTGSITTTDGENGGYLPFSGNGIAAINGYYGGYRGDGAAERARPAFTATDIIVDVVDVTSAETGVFALNYGTGEVSVTATGNVTGLGSIGILAVNLGGTDTTVNAADVNGKFVGIGLYSRGTGASTVTSTGKVTSNYYDGIRAINGYSSTDLTINAVDVSGGNDGIAAHHRGTGALSVTSTGTVTAAYGDGINVDGFIYGTNVTVNAHNVTAYDQGIDAHNNGSGSLTVNATGTVTGTSEEGIHALGSENGTDVTVSTVDVIGGTSGIYATNYGSGALSITSTGTCEHNIRPCCLRV